MNITIIYENLFSSWVTYSFLGMLFLGISMSLYKLPSSHKEIDSNGLNLWFGFFLFLLSSIFFLPYVNFSVSNVVIWVALVYGVIFTLRTLLQMHTLKYASTNALFPTSSITALLVVITVGIFFYGETLNFTQTIGIILSVVALFLFAFKGGKLTFNSIDVVKAWIGIVILSALGNLLNKVAADLNDIHTYQFFWFMFNFCAALIMLFIQKRDQFKEIILHRNTFLGGLGMGITGFLGSWSLIIALTKGPISVAQTINSSYVIVTAIVASIFFGETLTKRKVALIVLGIVALGFIKIGS